MSYWQKVTTLAARYPTDAVTTQLAAMTQLRTALIRRQLPPTALPQLGLQSDDWLAALVLPHANLAEVTALDHLLRHCRFYIAYHYGMWAFVHQTLFTEWTQLFGPMRYLEVAAGNGYCSLGLQQAGNQVITTDPLSWTSENVTGQTPVLPVTQAGATSALFRYGNQVDAVVMAWHPDKEPNDVRFLHVLRHNFPHLKLFVIGEKFGATNSRLFWQQAQLVPDRRLLRLNRAFGQFDAVHDRIYWLR